VTEPAPLAVPLVRPRIDESKSVPYHCPVCFGTENFYGILRFEGAPIPRCPNHEEPIALVPARPEPNPTLVSLMMLGQIGREAGLA